jgi:hypothetical protein
MVSQYPGPDDKSVRRLVPTRARTSSPVSPLGGRPAFRIEIPAEDGTMLLVLREVNGRLVAEGDESRWDEAARRFIYAMCQWAGQFPLRWKDEARNAVEGPQ